MSFEATTQELMALLGVAVLIALLAERLRVSSAVALVAFGAGTAAIRPFPLPFALSEVLLFVFLPPLIFEAAWNIDIAVLRRVGRRIALLAVPGVVLVAGLIGGGIAATGLLPFSAAMLFGTIVSATDPIAVIAIFRRLHVPVDSADDRRRRIDRERRRRDRAVRCRDGVRLRNAASIGDAAAHVVLAILGGIVVGIVCGFAVALLMGRTSEAGIEVTATFVLAFLAYLAAVHVGFSGVFATAAAAIALRAVQQAHPVAAHAERRRLVLEHARLHRQRARVSADRIDDADALASAAAAGAGRGRDRGRDRLARGADPARHPRLGVARARSFWPGCAAASRLALALALPHDLPYREQIVDAVFGVVLFTLVVQGLTLEPLLARLGSKGRRAARRCLRRLRAGGGGSGNAGSASETLSEPGSAARANRSWAARPTLLGARARPRFERGRRGRRFAHRDRRPARSTASNGTVSSGSRKSSRACSSITVLANASAFGRISGSARLRPRTIEASISARTPASGIPLTGTRL